MLIVKYLLIYFQIKDNTAREQWVKERSQSINQVREAERNADNVARNIAKEKVQWVFFFVTIKLPMYFLSIWYLCTVWTQLFFITKYYVSIFTQKILTFLFHSKLKIQ